MIGHANWQQGCRRCTAGACCLFPRSSAVLPPASLRSGPLSILLSSATTPAQNKLFGGLVGGAVCTVQLEVRSSSSAAAAGAPATISLKNKREEVETLPLFSSKDTISGEVGVLCTCREQSTANRHRVHVCTPSNPCRVSAAKGSALVAGSHVSLLLPLSSYGHGAHMHARLYIPYHLCSPKHAHTHSRPPSLRTPSPGPLPGPCPGQGHPHPWQAG